MTKFLTFFLLLSVGVNAQGVEFTDKPWNTLTSTALDQGKLIFVHVYTDWCKSCKKMDKEVYSDQSLGGYFNHRFINFKANAENGVGELLAKTHDINVYPTMLFFDQEGQLILKSPGSKTIDELVEEGEIASNPAPYNRYKLFKRKFENETTDKDILEEYLVLADRYNKLTDTIFDAYYQQLNIIDRQDEYKLGLIAKYVPNAESRAFDQARDYYLRMKNDSTSWDYKPVEKNLVRALEKSLALRCVDKMEDKLDEILDKKEFVLFAINPDDTMNNLKTLEFDRVRFYGCSQQRQMYSESAEGFVNSFIIDDERMKADSLEKSLTQVNVDFEDSQLLAELAQNFLKFYSDKERLDLALSWINQSIKWNNDFESHKTKALIEHKLGHKNEALRTARRALEKARKAKSPVAKSLEQTLFVIIGEKNSKGVDMDNARYED